MSYRRSDASYATRTTLFVSHLDPYTSAASLGRAFEQIGPIVRCDLPGRKLIAFVEYRDPRDATEAYYAMHNTWVDGAYINVEYARYQNPGPEWRNSEPQTRYRSPSPGRRYYRDRRSPSPPPRRRRSRSRTPRRYADDDRRYADDDRRYADDDRRYAEATTTRPNPYPTPTGGNTLSQDVIERRRTRSPTPDRDLGATTRRNEHYYEASRR